MVIQQSLFISVSFCQVRPSHGGFYCNAAAAAQSQVLLLLIVEPDGFLSTEGWLVWLKLFTSSALTQPDHAEQLTAFRESL